jgi:hypothetical protein
MGFYPCHGRLLYLLRNRNRQPVLRKKNPSDGNFRAMYESCLNEMRIRIKMKLPVKFFQKNSTPVPGRAKVEIKGR